MKKYWLAGLCLLNVLLASAQATFTLMSYNLLNYPGSTASTRNPAFRTVLADTDPDILVVQEIAAASGFTDFLNNVLNFSAPVYTAGTFIDGPDSDNGIYYKSSLFSFISNTPIKTALRDISEFRLKHIASGDTLIIYSVHLKSSTGSANEQARGAEVDSLRKVTNQHPATRHFMVCGDFNIYKSSEPAYVNLLQAGADSNGRFNDVLSMPGSWNNASYAAYHTQSPRTSSFGGGATGGLDDRFDMILFSNAVFRPGDLDVVAGSYKAYGNDGAHYNLGLDVGPYSVYSQTILSALHDASDHLPVIVKLVYNTLVPVSLLHFTGTRKPEGALLGWSTASETNADVFIVQRSADGAIWEEAGRVKASGSSSVKKDYAYLDRSCPENAKVYYRLRQDDHDRSGHYSTVLVVDAGKRLQDVVRVYPNPSASVFHIMSGQVSGPVEILVYDMQGRLVRTVPAGFDAAGAYELDLSELSPGVYYMRLKDCEGQLRLVKGH